jgi:RNA polymerase primary sigma factor
MARTGIDTYLSSIGTVPLLTPEQEIDLGRKVQRMLALQKEGKQLTPQQLKEVRVGERAVNRFVQSNLRLVVSASKRYAGVLEHMDLMDLVQEGNIGLMTAVRKFDPSRGYKFSTYAYWWIRQAMIRGIAAKERSIRLPGKVSDMASNWNKKVRELSQELRRMPTTEEMATAFDLPVEEVRMYLDRGKYVTSLDAVMMAGEGSAVLDIISDPRDPDGTVAMEHTEMQETLVALESALDVLTPKERDFVQRRWGLHGRPEETFVELGKGIGVSRERARQVVDQAQRKMKRYLMTHQAHKGEVLVRKSVGAYT